MPLARSLSQAAANRRTIPLLLAAFLFVASCAPRGPSTGGTPAAAGAVDDKGSDTMVNLALAWAQAYEVQHPDINVSVTGGGSGTGLAALINGTADIANASRAIKPEEASAIEAKGQKPVEFIVA